MAESDKPTRPDLPLLKRTESGTYSLDNALLREQVRIWHEADRAEIAALRAEVAELRAELAAQTPRVDPRREP
jgi:hypothetical protein